MPVKRRTVRSKVRRENKKRRPRGDRKMTASAGGPARELIRVDMKKMKATPGGSREFSGNGEVRKNGATRQPRSAAVSKHPKTELEAAIQRYVDLFEFAPIAYVTFNRVGRIEEINLAAAQLLGRSRDRLIGEPFALHVTKKDGALFLNHLLRCRSSDSCVETELRLKKRNGEIIVAHLASSPMTSSMRDGALLYQTAIVDLTERKRTEERLAEQARLLDLTNDAILVRDMQDRITYWNHGARELYGYSPEEALGKVTHKLLRTVPSQSLTNIRKKLERDNRWSGELVHTCKDGTKVIVISRWSLDRDAKGRPSSILETNTEITDRKRAEQRRAVNLAVTRILSESLALAHAVPRILRTVCETLGWEVGDFWTPKPDGRVLRCLVSESRIGKFSKFKAVSRKLKLAPGVGLPGRIWSNLKPAWISDITTDNNFPRAPVVAEEGLHGAFAFPISFGKHFVGVMEFFSLEIREPDEDVLKMFGSIGSQIGQFVQRKRAEAALQKSKELLEQLVRQRTKALRMSNAELKNEIERRKGLEGEILAVSDREQQRLGQELHDGLCQHLTAVAFMARSVALRLKNHRVIDASDIEKIAELVNDAATDTRNLSRALHRIDVDAAGLVNALQDLVDREIWKIPCRLEVGPSFQIQDDAAAAHLYRIAREAVINANKHAQAREIVVKLERSQQGMVLRVIDDGVGFSNEPKLKQGLGYHIMNYRAQLIGGRLKIERPKKGGTCVSCYFPDSILKRNEPNKERERLERAVPDKNQESISRIDLNFLHRTICRATL
jgi:PAS domain S-box-containing protein